MDEEIIEKSAEDAADAGSHDRYPPPAVRGPEDVGAPSRDGGKQPRPEIARWIDRVTGIQPVRRTDENDEQATGTKGKKRGRQTSAAADDDSATPKPAATRARRKT